MVLYRDNLPQLDGGLFMTDGGIETTLIYEAGFDLPEFAAVEGLRSDDGTEALRSYYGRYADLASEFSRLRSREPDLEGEPRRGPRV